MPDVASAADRMGPTIANRVTRFTFAAGANAAQRIFPDPPAGIQGPTPPRYISVLVVGAIANAGHLTLGDASVGAPTVDDPPFSIECGWQDMIMPARGTHFRVFGDGAGSTIYIWVSGI